MLLAHADVFSEGHEQSQAAGGSSLGAMKRTEFEILDVLTHHELTSLGFYLWGEISGIFFIASILPGFWVNRGFFFPRRKN